MQGATAQVMAEKKQTTKKAKPRIPKGLWSTSEVCEQLHFSMAQARNILAMVPAVKQTPRGDKYYEPEKVKEALAKIRNTSNHADEGSREWYEVEKLKRQVDKLDHELDKLKSKVIPIDEVREGVMKLAMEFRKHLEEQAAKLPPLVAGLEPQDIQGVIDNYNKSLLATIRQAHGQVG